MPKEKCEECKRIALDVIRVLKPTGPGGFDFLFQVGRAEPGWPTFACRACVSRHVRAGTGPWA